MSLEICSFHSHSATPKTLTISFICLIFSSLHSILLRLPPSSSSCQPSPKGPLCRSTSVRTSLNNMCVCIIFYSFFLSHRTIDAFVNAIQPIFRFLFRFEAHQNEPKIHQNVGQPFATTTHYINAFVRSSFTYFYFTNGFIVSTFSSVIIMAASRTGQSSSQSTSIDVNFCVVSVSFSVYPFYHPFSINLHSRHRSRAYSLHSPHLTSYWCLVIPSCNPI